MRTTLTVDDALWERVEDYFGTEDKSSLIRRALKEMVAREAGRRLAALGGTMPGFTAAPRRRPEGWPDEE